MVWGEPGTREGGVRRLWLRLRGEKTVVGAGPGWWEARGSVLRRKKEQVGLPGFQLRAPAAAPSQQQPTAQCGQPGALMGVLSSEIQTSDVCP